MQQDKLEYARATLGEIWFEILDRYPEPQDDFFDIGGDSMELVRLLVAVRERFGLEMSIDDLFPESFTFGPSVDAVARAVAMYEDVAPGAGGDA